MSNQWVPQSFMSGQRQSDALQRADCAVPDQLTGDAEGGGKAALVVEGQLDAVALAGLDHAPRFAKGGRDRLFAVDGLHAGFGCGQYHFGVQMGPDADGYDVRSFLG